MKRLWIILLLFMTTAGFGQDYNLSSPYASIRTFYDNTQDSSLDLSTASRVISSRHVFSKKRRETLIHQLKLYLDETGVIIDFDSIPTDINYLDSASNRHIYTLASGIVLEKFGKNWYLSKTTVSKIPDKIIAKVEEEKSDIAEEVDNKKKREQARREREVQLAKIARMPVNLSSPYATIKFYTENIETEPVLASRIISGEDIPNLSKRIEIVEMLNRFFQGKGVLLDLDLVPEDPDYVDSTRTNINTYEINYRFSDIYLEKQGKSWLLSKESAEKIPNLYKTAFPFGSDRLLKYLPTEGRIEFFGLFLWQYIAILVIVALTYIVFRLLNWSITYLVTKILFRFGYKDIAQTYVNPIVRPIGLLFAFLLAETATPLLQLPIKVTGFISVTVELLIPLFATIAVYKAMDLLGLYFEKLASKTDTTFDDQLVPIIRKILKTFVVIIGGVFVLQNLNVNIGLLLGGLSVGGLALALAAQDTIKNFFGSLMIFVDKPFQAGHWIVTPDGIDGTVEQVGFRSTRIRTFANSVITVPNGKLSDAVIDNFGLRAYRRFKTQIAVTYDTPPDVLDLFIEGLREIVKQHPHTRKDMYHIYMNDMGAHSLNILFYIFFITPSWGEELKYRHEIIISIIRLAHNLGVNFAFPTQTLHMETFPGQMPLSPIYEQADKLEPKMKKFFDEQKKGDKDNAGN
jgi:MscS family membrane protein